MFGFMLSLGIYILIFLSYTNCSLSKNSDNFGPFDCKYNEFYLCKGSKVKNLTSSSAEFRETNGRDIGTVNVTFLERTKLEEVKITVYSIKGSNKTVLWSYNLKDPCQHFLIATIIESASNARNCNIEKGSYSVTLILNEFLKSLLGSSFFYGEYSLKASVLSKKGNVLCVFTTMSITKLKQQDEKNK